MRLPVFIAAAAWSFVATVAVAVPALADASEPEWRHASALTGEPGYAPGFTHFDYVNPDAPKGGVVRLSDSTGFDSFNPVLTQKGNAASGLAFIYETLMTPALDELSTSASYGLIAEAVRFPDDYAWVEYRLNPKARWHDGELITTDDVIFSLEAAKEVDPGRAFYYADVVGAEAVDDRTVRFTFKGPGNKELPHIVGQLTILPKHWWTGTDANGEQRSIESTTLEPPLGSGPYRIASFEPNRSLTYERVDDYWGADLPSMVGKDNFDQIRYIVYRDRTVSLEAFKSDQYDFRSENSAKAWATQYNFPAVQRGYVVLEDFPDEARGVMQAFVLNLRLPKFQDQRVRRALNLLYDFESVSETIYYGQYHRISSFFDGTELASSDLPEGKELEILELVRGEVPESVFTTPYSNPVNGTPENIRANQREALRLFQEAGYEIRNGTMVNAETGEPFTIEVIENDPNSERSVLPYAQSLGRLGIDMNLRIMDTSQYINRLRNRDFEMTTLGWGQSLSPGNEQREYWGSESANRPGSQNWAGISNPAIDKLIERLILAEDRETLVAATKALDRVLLSYDYMVPQFSIDYTRTARWDRFGRPDNIPPYTTGFPTIWWYDDAKAAAIRTPS